MTPHPTPSLYDLEHGLPFVDRHVGPRADELATMLATIGVASLGELADRALPAAIRDRDGEGAGALPAPATEAEALAELRALAARNHVTVPMIGLGYSGTVTPPVIRRNVLENPAWYTAYTPYQPEISQGRLEALLTFQTTVADLTGLPVAGASLLDEATAAAEAMTLLRRAGKAKTAPPASSSTPTPCRRRWRFCAPGPRRWASSWWSPTSVTACPTGSSSACCCPTPGPRARSATRRP